MSCTIKRTKSRCDKCPLRDEKRVWGTSDFDKPEIAMFAEAPGAVEAAWGKGLVGPAGKWAQRAVADSGHKWGTVFRSNAIVCRPPDNDITSPEAIEALKCCEPGMWEEIDTLKRMGVKVIMPTGNTAMHAFGIDGAITRNRGSVYDLKRIPGLTIIPTFHPSYLMRGNARESVTWVNDIKKAYEITRDGHKKLKESFNLFPTLTDVREFVDRTLAGGKPIGVDTETTSLNKDRAKIIMLGIASSTKEAIVIPFLKKGGERYWETLHEEQQVLDEIRRLVAQAPCVFQNAMFDMRVMRSNGIKDINFADDILGIHHAINAELPHKLGYIVSQYGETPYWKDLIFKGDHWKIYDDSEFRTYNARDCVTLLQVLPRLKEDARSNDTLATYERFFKQMIWPLIWMEEAGIGLSKHRLDKYRRELEPQVIELERQLRALHNLPSSFNFASGDHMRYLFFGIIPAQYATSKAIVTETLTNPRKSKTSKEFLKRKGIVEVFETVTPLTIPTKYHTKKTDSGAASTDAMALLTLQIAINNRLEELSQLKRATQEHTNERASLEHTSAFLQLFNKWSEVEKQFTTYTKFESETDGRVHANFNPTGTRTGRLSSSDPNLQNLQENARIVFVAKKGHVFVGPDYSNLEIGVLGYVSGDTAITRPFERGENIHDINCRDMFGLTPSDPDWHDSRYACKKYQFGRNYGGSLRGIYQKVVIEVPKLGLTFKRFSEVDRNYQAKHPIQMAWRRKLEAEVRKTRCLTNPFGRKRYFHGLPNAIVREGLNFPIQSTADDIMKVAFIELSYAFETGLATPSMAKAGWTKGKLLALHAHCVQIVHDQLVVECPTEQRAKVASLMKLAMEQPHRINGRTCYFPVEFKVGTDLYNMHVHELRGTRLVKDRKAS